MDLKEIDGYIRMMQKGEKDPLLYRIEGIMAVITALVFFAYTAFAPVDIIPRIIVGGCGLGLLVGGSVLWWRNRK